MKKILIIQTAFIGDVILATSLVETIQSINKYEIDFLVRKGNEVLLADHPHIKDVLIWKKKENKYKNLLAISKTIRANKYHAVFNLQRFASTGFITWRSKAKFTIGFKNNPLSFLFKTKVKHKIGNGLHEIERNATLLHSYFKQNSIQVLNPKLYTSNTINKRIDQLIEKTTNYVVMAPASVWFTKQLPAEKWVELIKKISQKHTIYLIGAPADKVFIQDLVKNSLASNCINMAGELNLLESAGLIAKAKRAYVNDSAPLHLASAMNTPTTAFFCSTVPSFGFGPLAKNAEIIEVKAELDCRPCGLHGFKTCPKKHFNCGNKIDLSEF